MNYSMNSKICNKCGVKKVIADYYIHKSKNRLDKPFSNCKSCCAAHRYNWINALFY